MQYVKERRLEHTQYNPKHKAKQATETPMQKGEPYRTKGQPHSDDSDLYVVHFVS